VPPVYCPNMAAVRAILCFIHALIVDIAASQLPRIKKDGGWGGRTGEDDLAHIFRKKEKEKGKSCTHAWIPG
jgi:hypothetical protein